jgi:serine/threonine protein kinase
VPGGSPTPASDIFGIGILGFFALTGQLPVPYEGDEAQYWERLRGGEAPRVQTVRSDLPDDLAAIIDRCLQRQPARRYLDAMELLADLPGDGGTR